MDVTELAGLLHAEMCDRGQPCPYSKPGHPHHVYYVDRARELHDRLEPLIGSANVWPAALAVLDILL